MGRNNGFTFKQFHIDHDRCAMKVGTDGILLGAWAPVDSARRVLDIGTGSGLIAPDAGPAQHERLPHRRGGAG